VITNLLRLIVPVIFLAALAARAADPANPIVPIPSAAQILQMLKPGHPRLLMSTADFARLKEQVATEEPLRTWHLHLQDEAKSILAARPSEYEIPDGLRLLSTSKRVLERVQTLALLYRLDGDPRYARRAWRELDAAAHFKDWNNRHFLDTAEMTHAFAIGYDWLYDYWTPQQRAELRAAMIEKGLKPALKIENEHRWWAAMNHNWNQVCNGGIGMGALALADEEPQLAGDFLHASLQSLQLPMVEYGPDGAWAEGPGYWHYATSYNVLYLAALQTALGTDFGLSKINGFSEAGTFPIFASGPAGLSFDYADSHAGILRAPEMFWLAREFNRPEYGWRQLQVAIGSPLDLIWYDARFARPPSAPPPLDKYYRHCEIATLRSAWNDTNALFVGFKAGDNQANHSHLDLGSFVLDALGQRWAVDLGADDYNMPGYFDFAHEKRWIYYRLRAEGHNTLVINPTNAPDQNVHAVAAITRFESKPELAFAVADLTDAYAPSVRKAERGIRMINRRMVVVQDEIQTINPAELWWFLHTSADIKIAPDGSSAMLKMQGRRLAATIAGPKAARFEVLPAAPLPGSPNPPGQAVNHDIRVLAIHLKNVTTLRLVVNLTPLAAAESSALHTPEIKPLADW
jgi:hypothetical protein